MDSRSEDRRDEPALRARLVAGMSGDARAYRDFLQAVADLLRVYFRKRLTSLPDEVEDMVQETLLAIHEKRHTYDPSLPVTAWVYAIARYKWVDLLRRRGRHERRTDSLDAEAPPTLRAPDHDPTSDLDLDSLLARLPERQRACIRHMKIEGLSVAETAQRTGQSESAVKVGVHRGLKALARFIRGES